MFLTQEEVLEAWSKNESREYKEQKDRIKKLRKNIETARDLITDAKKRYIKKKVKARSIKKATEENPFKDLEEYDYKYENIQNAYGYDCIDDKEFERLAALLEVFEASKTEKGKEYRDEVTDFLDEAFRAVIKPYIEEISEFENKEYEKSVAAKKFAEQNNEEEWDYIHKNKSNTELK